MGREVNFSVLDVFYELHFMRELTARAVMDSSFTLRRSVDRQRCRHCGYIHNASRACNAFVVAIHGGADPGPIGRFTRVAFSSGALL